MRTWNSRVRKIHIDPQSSQLLALWYRATQELQNLGFLRESVQSNSENPLSESYEIKPEKEFFNLYTRYLLFCYFCCLSFCFSLLWWEILSRGYLLEIERPCATWKLGATELLVQWYRTIQQIFLRPFYVLAPSDMKVITWLLCFKTFQLYILYSLILYKELTMLACLPNTRDAKTKSIYMHQPPHRGLITYNHAPFQIFPGWHFPSMAWFLHIL